MRAAAAFPSRPDQQLIRRCCSGDIDSFYTLMRPYERTMYIAALALAGNPTDAERLAQDAALSAYQTLSQFRDDESFETWLIGVTWKAGREAFCRRNPVGHSGSANDGGMDAKRPHDVSPWHEIPLQALGNKAVRDLIAAAIEGLPARLRVVFVLRDVLKQSLVDSGRILEIEEDEFKSRLNMARLQMIAWLAPLANTSQSSSAGRTV